MPRRTLFQPPIVTAMFCLVLFCGCSSPANTSNSGGATASVSPSPTQPQSTAIDPCSLFSAAEAQQIMGAPMKLSSGHGATVCMYEETTTKSGEHDIARVSLTLNVRKSAEEEKRAWSNIKVVRQLKPGAKNISVLIGIGDEAWLDGHIEQGKLGTGGILARQGKSDFMLESSVLAYRASPDALKSMAKKIADQLQ